MTDLEKRLGEENDKLRGIIAKSTLDCIYCGLKAEDMNRCLLGFPGCDRMDDIMAVETFEDVEIPA